MPSLSTDSRSPRFRLAAVPLALCTWMLAATAHAQVTPQQVSDEGLRRQEERTRDQQRGLQTHADVLRPAEAQARSSRLPDESPCFVITDISLAGPESLRLRWLLASAQPFLGQCVGVKGLQRIADALDAALIEQGLVTSRVSLGPQNLSSGRLVFQLDAGRIAQVRMVEAGAAPQRPDDRWGTWVNAFPTSAGRLLDTRDIEQGVEQMKRLPSQTVTTTLEPGPTPNTSIVTIHRQTAGFKDRLRGGVTLDNSGSASLGRTQLSMNVALDNALGVNDIASLSINSNAEHPHAEHRSQSAAFSYSVPLGYSTFSASTSHNRFAQIVPLTTTRTLSSGDSDSANLRWDHIVWRTASTKTAVYADLSTRKARSFIDDVELLVQRRRTTFIETGASLRQIYAGGSNLDLSLGYRRGMPWLDAEDDLAADSGLTLRPHIWTLTAGLNVPFKSPAMAGMAERLWQFSTSLRVQSTSDRTLSIDQMAIGNRGTVRGFDGDAVLIAESGYAVRNELSTPVPWLGADASAYAGVDFGRVWGPSDVNLVGRFLAGAALGVRGKWRRAQFDLALAGPLRKPERFKTADLNPYASMTFAF